jgi:hypothetical protein
MGRAVKADSMVEGAYSKRSSQYQFGVMLSYVVHRRSSMLL